MPNLYNSAYKLYRSINSSKLLAGLGMIFLNLLSKYVVIDLSKSQEAFIRNTVSREILIFVIAFVGTREIITSLLITASLAILSGTIFNAQSRLCVLPHKYRYLDKIVDTNKDGHVSNKEIKEAKDILYKANIQKHKAAQLNDLNYFQSNI